MAQNNIPNHIRHKAQQEGFNSVTSEGRIDEADIYAVAVLDENGNPTPIGLPTFITDDGNNLSIVSGNDGLDLLLRLQKS